MNIEIMDIGTAKRLLKEISQKEKSEIPASSIVDRLRLARKVIIDVEEFKDQTLKKPSDLFIYSGVNLFGGLGSFTGFGGDKGACIIANLERRLRRSPSKADFLGYVFDDLIATFSDPHVQQLLAQAEATKFKITPKM